MNAAVQNQTWMKDINGVIKPTEGSAVLSVWCKHIVLRCTEDATDYSWLEATSSLPNYQLNSVAWQHSHISMSHKSCFASEKKNKNMEYIYETIVIQHKYEI